MAAFWLSGCSHDAPPAATPQAPSTARAPAQGATLPNPQALTGVLDRLADPAVPGAQKTSLVEATTAQDSAALDKFTKALSDNQMLPLTFVATDLAWSTTDPGNVSATVNIIPPAPKDGSAFTFPMDFKPAQGGWQLSRDTADMLLAFGDNPTPAPATPPR